MRSAGEPFFTPPSRPRKRKLGLGPDARPWIEKIRRGELLPSAPIVEKVTKEISCPMSLFSGRIRGELRLASVRTVMSKKIVTL